MKKPISTFFKLNSGDMVNLEQVSMITSHHNRTTDFTIRDHAWLIVMVSGNVIKISESEFKAIDQLLFH